MEGTVILLLVLERLWMGMHTFVSELATLETVCHRFEPLFEEEEVAVGGCVVGWIERTLGRGRRGRRAGWHRSSTSGSKNRQQNHLFVHNFFLSSILFLRSREHVERERKASMKTKSIDIHSSTTTTTTSARTSSSVASASTVAIDGILTWSRSRKVVCWVCARRCDENMGSRIRNIRIRSHFSTHPVNVKLPWKKKNTHDPVSSDEASINTSTLPSCRTIPRPSTPPSRPPSVVVSVPTILTPSVFPSAG